ncbi:DUF4143 domain-containing protein [Spirosoma montaniterrae]|uniref:DUF4143 domain-containing protein n=1 Tax=Spirosoma montaniterrae TaxID=1178516 RepID=UPI003AAEDDC4
MKNVADLSTFTRFLTNYVVYLLPPYYENFSKRLIKSPELYFYDTGLLCSLLGLWSSPCPDGTT